jgi:hypothetical protein
LKISSSQFKKRLQKLNQLSNKTDGTKFEKCPISDYILVHMGSDSGIVA